MSLGLVYVDATRPPWENHQVLAVGHFLRQGERVIEVYDPNYPRTLTFLHVTRLIHTHDRAGDELVKPFRGFFATTYAPRQPPW